MRKTLSLILMVLLALVVGTFVFRIFAWFMWHLFLPIVFGLIILFVITRLLKR